MSDYIDPELRALGEMKFLPQPDLSEALAAPNKAELFVAGYYNYTEQHLLLFRGNGHSLIVPASFFTPNAKFSPDFNQFDLTDYGQTVKLGDYEASASSILYEFDLSYKERFDENRIRKGTQVLN